MFSRKAVCLVLAVLILGTPFLVAAETAKDTAPKADIVVKPAPPSVAKTATERQLQRALRAVLGRAVLTRDITAVQYWRIQLLLRRNPEAAAQVHGFLVAGILEGEVCKSEAEIASIDWEAILKFLWEHREEILEFVLMIISLFAQSGPTSAWISGVASALPVIASGQATLMA